MKKKVLLIIASAAMPLVSCGVIANIGDGEGMPYTMSETRANIDNLAQSSGIEVSLKSETYDDEDGKQNGTTTFGAVNGVYWSVETEEKEGNAVVFDKEAGRIYSYSYYAGVWEYSYTDDLATCGYTESTLFFGLSTWLYTGHAYGSFAKTKGTEKVAGRDCVVLEYGVNAIGASAGYTIAFDKETGATLKLKVSSDTVEESIEATFEVTSFKTSGIVAPTLPAPVDVE